MKFEVNDIIYANQCYSWHDTENDGRFHDVQKNDRFKVLSFCKLGMYNTPHVYLQYFKDDCVIMMATKELELRFNLRILRREKLNKIFANR
jgi:hypothetical protein